MSFGVQNESTPRASVFRELLAARIFGGYDCVSYNFLRPKFSAKNSEQINLYQLTQICLQKALKQSKKAENDISSVLLKFSRWLPLKIADQIGLQSLVLPLLVTTGA